MTVAGPLTTIFRASEPLPRQPGRISVELVIPAQAPRDLGVGAFLSDQEGNWYQRLAEAPLTPGRHRLHWDFSARTAPMGEPHRGGWIDQLALTRHRAGIFLWTTSGQITTIAVQDLRVEACPAPDDARPGRLRDISWDDDDPDTRPCQTSTGHRWTIRFRPAPFPAQPFDPGCFLAELTVIRPDGVREVIPAFCNLGVDLLDRGDREVGVPSATPWFEIRYRPRLPGRHQLRLEGRWPAGKLVRCELPPLHVSGPIWDDVARVDAGDPRFLSTGALTGKTSFLWPLAINLRSVNDPRGAERTGTRLTPARGFHAYEAYLRRLAAAGVTGCEIWMSSWNLALEWRRGWPGFHGLDGYHAANAERLDRILDLAWSLGIRVNLVIRNHGMASLRVDREWPDNPFAREQQGPCASAPDFFTQPEALALQDRLDRYLVARWADHPAILAWKLWTEINLTAARREELRTWHRSTSERFRVLDAYRHPVTTHWSSDYRVPDRSLVTQPGIDLICIDAYHARGERHSGPGLLDLLVDGLHQAEQGLGRYGKPVLVTECGGNWNACPPPQLEAEHATGPWAALVSGYAGSPMLWWFEWVDQGNRWAPFTAISRFLAGEDLRDPEARSQSLTATDGTTALWARAWLHPGRRMLAYVTDPAWAFDGQATAARTNTVIHLPGEVEAGRFRIEWWDADTGRKRATVQIDHPGGPLVLRPHGQPWQHHLAFKLLRE